MSLDPERDLYRILARCDINDCWVWTGGITSAGYGTTSVGSRYDSTRRGVSPHRYVYEQLVGVVNSELVLDHLCINRLCCNPDHLEPVSVRENNMRSFYRGSTKTYCTNGHRYTQENIYVNPTSGSKVCRTCMRANARKRVAA